MAIKTGTNARDVLTGTAAADTLRGLGGNDDLFGGDDNDTLDGGADNDKLFGGNGNDTLVGGTGNDTLSGELGNDVLHGGVGLDTILGGPGNDILTGDDNNNSLIGGAGADQLQGGEGNDFLRPGPGTTTHDTIVGGNGNDTLSYSDYQGSVSIDLVTNTNAQYNSIQGIENVIGSAFDNSLRGVLGGSFHLTSGGGGNDTVTATSETYDRIRGDAGYDTLVGSNGDAEDFWLQYDQGMDVAKNFIRSDGDHVVVVKTEFNLNSAASGFLNPVDFAVRTDNRASSADTRLILETDTRILWADKDGNGTKFSAIPIAVFDHTHNVPLPTDIFVF